MEIDLDPEAERMIEEYLKNGMYKSPGDVIFAALGALKSVETMGDFEPGELDRLIEEGDKGEPLDGEKVLAELRELRIRAEKRAG